MEKITELLIKNKIFDLQVKYRLYDISYKIVNHKNIIYLQLYNSRIKVMRPINLKHINGSIENTFECFVFYIERIRKGDLIENI